MSDPNDPTRPMDPVGGADDDTPDLPGDDAAAGGPPEPLPGAEDPTLIHDAPPVVGSAAPGMGGEPIPAADLDDGLDGGLDDGDDLLDDEWDDEYGGWWAERTTAERAAVAAGIALVGIVLAILFIGGGDDPVDDTLPPVVITTTTFEFSGTTTTTTPTSATTTTATNGVTTTTTDNATTTTTNGGTTTTTPDDTTTTTSAGTTSTTALPTFPSVNGTGVTTVPFVIPDDLPATIRITHDGAMTFVVASHDANGNEIATLVERPGTYQGTVVVNLDPSDPPVAALNIIADGDWSATAAYLGSLTPRPLNGLSASSDMVVRLDLTAAVSATFGHDGSRDFIITAYDGGGAPSVLIDEFGTVSPTVTVPAGTSYMSIVADGNWTIATT